MHFDPYPIGVCPEVGFRCASFRKNAVRAAALDAVDHEGQRWSQQAWYYEQSSLHHW